MAGRIGAWSRGQRVKDKTLCPMRYALCEISYEENTFL